jgi:hypothetical protein
MRKLLLLAAGIGATMLVRRRAAEQGVTPGTLVNNSLQQAMAWLAGMPERIAAPPPAGKARRAG